VLRRIFGPNREEATRQWGQLHNQELNIFLFIKYYYDDQIKENGMGKACSIYGGEKKQA
jgi:hypothetical protein